MECAIESNGATQSSCPCLLPLCWVVASSCIGDVGTFYRCIVALFLLPIQTAHRTDVQYMQTALNIVLRPVACSSLLSLSVALSSTLGPCNVVNAGKVCSVARLLLVLIACWGLPELPDACLSTVSWLTHPRLAGMYAHYISAPSSAGEL